VAVKVLSDQGSGSYAGIIAGVDWALNAYHQGSGPAVANLSLGGPTFQPLDEALTNAMKQGLFVVVAAGGSNADACNSSPGGAKDLICVGSTDRTATTPPTDVRSTFSSFGPCVDIFAPGSNIPGAWIGSRSATRILSGTSMSAPHVAGVAALIFGAKPGADWIEVTDVLTKETATHGVIDLRCGTNTICQQTPNSLVFNGCDH